MDDLPIDVFFNLILVILGQREVNNGRQCVMEPRLLLEKISASS